MVIPLSVLDVSPVVTGATSREVLQNTLDLARFADQRGYTRYWLAEHHNSPGIASTTPEIMIARIAHETQNIRVGSGGVMLPNHAPLKVAESFKLLEALYPDRVDLGLGRAPGTDGMTAIALRRSREALNADDFPQNLAELLAFANGSFPESHPFKTIAAYPQDVPLPPIWLLGSSDFSARLAAQEGMGFSFAHHINGEIAAPMLRLYRQSFQPSAQFQQPHAILAASVICAETDEEAQDLALSVSFAFFSLHLGLKHGALPSPEEVKAYPLTPEQQWMFEVFKKRHIAGSPATVKAQLGALIEQSQADEVMILAMVHDHAARVRSYDLIAEAFGVEQRG